MGSSKSEKRKAESGVPAAHSISPSDVAGLAQAAGAWEEDMQPARIAIVAAMHSGDERSLKGLRHLLPGLLRQVNEVPNLASFASVLDEAMRSAFLAVFESGGEIAPQVSANAAVTFSEAPAVTHAMRDWRRREAFETNMGSAELRGLGREFANRSIFSARTTNAEYLRDVQRVVDEILSGQLGMAQGRYQLMRKLKEVGYSPETGFSEDYGQLPPAERGSLQDLSSSRRIDLVLETNVRMAQGYAQVVNGNTSTSRFANPAWELVRLYPRETPRGTPESHSVGWQRRWSDAGEACGWVGASKAEMVALKDSPLWQALGDGEGGYVDTLLNPFPPFAFRSGMAWRAIPRERALQLGLIQADTLPEPISATLSPSTKEVRRVVDEMPPDLRAELLRELGLQDPEQKGSQTP